MNNIRILKVSLLSAVLLVCLPARLQAASRPAGSAANVNSIKLTNGLTYGPVRIVGVADGFIRFRMGGGSAITKPLKEVAVVTLAADKDFTQAEYLLRQGKYSQAEAAYKTAKSNTAAPWKKALIDYRLLAAAEAAGQIDKATERWLKMVNAAAGTLAMRPRKLGPVGSDANKRAIAMLKAKAKDAKPAAKVKAIRELLLDLYEHEGRTAEARAVVKQLAGKAATASQTKPSSQRPGTEIPAAGSFGVELRLASLSLKDGRYKEAVEQLQPRLKRFAAAELPPALLMLGRAKLEMSRKKSDNAAARELLVEAGLDLMRVVVFFPSSAEAPRALLSAAEVNERLGNIPAARAAYSVVAGRFAGSPAAKEAQKALERMKKGTRD